MQLRRRAKAGGAENRVGVRVQGIAADAVLSTGSNAWQRLTPVYSVRRPDARWSLELLLAVLPRSDAVPNDFIA
jgi:hypothetical protein